MMAKRVEERIQTAEEVAESYKWAGDIEGAAIEIRSSDPLPPQWLHRHVPDLSRFSSAIPRPTS